MTLSLYLSRFIGARIFMCWGVLLLIALGIDLLRASSDLIDRGGVPMVAQYAWYSFPLIGTVLVPISALTGAIIGFLTLVARSELTVVRAAGKSTWSLLASLMPLALLLGLCHHLLGDTLTTWSERGLSEMFPLEVGASTEAEDAREVWLREGNSVIRAVPVAGDGSVLENFALYRLDADGALVDRLTAESARYDGDGWNLTSALRWSDGSTVDLGATFWEGRITPHEIFIAAEASSVNSMDNVRAVLAGEAVPTRGQAYYETRLARSYVAYAVPGIMLLVAVLATFGTARHGGNVKLAALAVVLGFLFIVMDGFVGSLGEIGALDPLLAAGFSSGVLLVAVIWCVLVQES